MLFSRRNCLATFVGIFLACSFVFEAAGEAVVLPLGTDPQTIIAANPAGTEYELQAGLHRGYEIVLKEGDTLVGQAGAIMSGAEVLSGWRYEDPYWVHDGPHSKVVPDYDETAKPWELRSRYPHDLFVDDIPLRQVFGTNGVRVEETWYYDYNADKIYIGFDPSNRVLELGGLCRFGMRSTASGITVKKIRFEKYATTGQTGAVQVGVDAVVEDCVIYGSHATGLRMGARNVVRNCRFAWNGLCGVQNGGEGTLVEFCEADHNGWAGFSGNWSRGGIKVPAMTNGIVRRNYAHHNTGPGIWLDINAHNVLIEENLCEYNSWEGILYEMSCECVLRRNVARWNGLIPRDGLLWGAPLIVQNGEGGDIYENYLEASSAPGARAAGVSIINQPRAEHEEGPCGVHVAERNHIHHNVIVLPNGGYNGLQYGTFGWESFGDFLLSGNLWEQNTYYSGHPTSGNFHWFEQGDTEADLIPSFHSWDSWRALGQDLGSQWIVKTPDFFNVTNPELETLIEATTGVSYAVLKAPFLPPPYDPSVDSDSDGMPDGWEEQFGLDPGADDAAGNFDGDTLANLEEHGVGCDPTKTDSDGDGLSDGWEVTQGTNPIVADAFVDIDVDSLSNREEFEAGLLATVADGILGQLPGVPTLWLKPGISQVGDPGSGISRWLDWRGTSLFAAETASNFGPTESPNPLRGWRMMQFGPESLAISGGSPFGLEEEGWTISLVVRPREVDGLGEEFALMESGEWKVSGFRVTVDEGYLHFFSTQTGSSLSIRSLREMRDGEAFVLTLQYDGLRQEGRMYIDGVEQGRSNGRLVGGNLDFRLGWIEGFSQAQPVDIGELLLLKGALGHLERREVEAMLLAKYFGTGVAAGDGDGDGMPTWWELENGLDPLTDDAAGDGDDDGLNNSGEFFEGTIPFVSDTDGDGMPDGWEVSSQLDPLLVDANGDYDSDLFSNLEEFEGGTAANLADDLAGSIPEDAIAFWLRPERGFSTSGGGGELSWADWRNPELGAEVPSGEPDPYVSGWPVQGAGRLIDLALGSFRTTGEPLFGAELPGWTISLAIRPHEIVADEPRSLLGNDVWQESGFRLILNSGRLKFYSTQPEEPLLLQSTEALAADELVIVTLWFDASGREGRLYLNGIEQDRGEGWVPPNELAFRLGHIGGIARQPIDIGDVLVFSRPLELIERREVEAMLAGKYLNEGLAAGDGDLDQMPDWWELEQGLDLQLDDSGDDLEPDQLNNLREFEVGSDTNVFDTDRDGLPDGWEADSGTDPLVPDAGSDPDSDKLNNLVEFDGGTEPLLFDPLARELPGDPPLLWLKPGADQSAIQSGEITSWGDARQTGLVASAPSAQNAPVIACDTSSGYPLVSFGPGFMSTSAPMFSEPDGDWTLTFVARFRPTSGPSAWRAVMGNSVWRQSGFRFLVKDGRLRLSSTQLIEPIYLISGRALAAGESEVVTVRYDGANRRGALYIGGVLEAEGAGWIPANAVSLSVGVISGVETQPFDLGELVVFPKALSAFEQREVEAMLEAKFLGRGLAAGDSDGNTLPDAWETEFAVASLDPQSDDDGDSLNVLEEAWFGTDPLRADSDGDGRSDSEEFSANGKPWLNDAISVDHDGDGLGFGDEVRIGTDPCEADSDGDGMADGWEVSNYLDPLWAAPDADTDFDGLSDLDESLADSDPVEWVDVDSDGLHDRWEAANALEIGAGSLDSDSDGDGLRDIFEFLFGSDPRDGTVTDGPAFVAAADGRLVFQFWRSRVATAWYDLDVERMVPDGGWVGVPEAEIHASGGEGGERELVQVEARGENEEFFRVRARFRQ